MSAERMMTDEFLPTRRSLLTRLKNWEDQESWRQFVDEYGPLIYSVVRKAGFTDAEAQDIVQDVVVAVARKMRGFHYDPGLGSFKAWLLLNVRSRITDHWRRRQCRIRTVPPTDDTQRTSLVESVPQAGASALDQLWEQEWQEHLLQAALARVKEQVSPRQFQIFDLYVTQAIPLRKITELLGVSAAQVYLAKHRVARQIRKEIDRLKAGDRAGKI